MVYPFYCMALFHSQKPRHVININNRFSLAGSSQPKVFDHHVLFWEIVSNKLFCSWGGTSLSHINAYKVIKTARIRNQYNQVPHQSQYTKRERDKITINITNKSQEVSPIPSGDHKAAMNRRESMTNTRHK